MARLRYNFNLSGSSGRRNPQQNMSEPVIIQGILLGVGVFILLPLFPPLGIVWCAVIGKLFYETLKKEGMIKTNVENKLDFDWEKAKKSGREAAEKLKQRISASDIMDEKQPYKHPHTPVNYSYDKCAKDRRLEQIKTLKEAGIIDEAEYKTRRQKILAGK